MARLARTLSPALLLVLLALSGARALRTPELSIARKGQSDQRAAGEIARIDADLEDYPR